MQTNNEVKPRPTGERGQFVTASVTSKDGTTIGYYRIGRGPGLVILHGSMQSALSHRLLAEALAGDYTVYLVDRRGRPLSGPFGPDYSTRKEVEDLDAVLTATGATYVFGVSSGALITLNAALSLPAIQKIGIFEPPLIVNGSLETDWIKTYDDQMAQGKTADAMVTGMLGAQMGPPFMAKLPRWLLKWSTNRMMVGDDKQKDPEVMPMRQLAPTLHYDLAIALENVDKQESFRPIKAETLLLGGGWSRDYLKNGLNVLQIILPGAKRVEMPGVHHGVTGSPKMGGKPQVVAEELRKFF